LGLCWRGGCLTQTSSSTLVTLSRDCFSDSLSLSGSSSIPANATFLVLGLGPTLIFLLLSPVLLSELVERARASFRLPFLCLREFAPGELWQETPPVSSPPTRSGAEPGLLIVLSAQVRSIFTAPDRGVRFLTPLIANFTLLS